jgi:hypothetical protein
MQTVRRSRRRAGERERRLRQAIEAERRLPRRPGAETGPPAEPIRRFAYLRESHD